jgi:hypothetical protein
VTARRPLSLSGVEIDGESLVRFVYLDESGISSKEDVTIVAGVIIDADKQWKAIEQYVEALIEEYVPKEHQHGFVFHAKELFHGSQIFDPAKYPMARRREALKKLIAIPATFGLPMVYGYSDKAILPELHRQYPRHQNRVFALQHANTYALCAIGVERYMREHAQPDEIATLIAENNENARYAVKKVHYLLRGKNLDAQAAEVAALWWWQIGSDYLPIRKIVDCVHFASKDEAILLQLADACAFVYRRYLEKKPDTEEFFNALTNNNPKELAISGKDDGSIHEGYKILYFVPKAATA